MQLRKLTRNEYNDLSVQFDNTPDPSDGGGSGEHMILAQVLHQLGFSHGNRMSDYRTAQKLLDMGWKDE